MTALTNYTEDAWLNHSLRNTAYTPAATVYAALFTAAPGEAGGGTEISTSGTNYTRKAVTFAAAASRAIANSAAVQWLCDGTTFGTVTHWGIFDASSAGNLLAYGSLASGSVAVVDGQTYDIAIGGIAVEITTGGAVRMTSYLVHKLLDLTFRNTAYTSPAAVYLGYTSTLTDDDGGGTEMTGGSYARNETAFGAPSSNTCSNSDEESIAYTGVDPVGWFLADASTGGNRLFHGATPQPSKFVVVAAAGLQITLN